MSNNTPEHRAESAHLEQVNAAISKRAQETSIGAILHASGKSYASADAEGAVVEHPAPAGVKVWATKADGGGCGYYRIQMPADAINKHVNGVEVRVESHLSVNAEIRDDGNTVTLFDWSVPEFVPDVVVVQRPLSKTLAKALVGLRKILPEVRIVVELDDNFDTVSSANAAWAGVQPHLSPGSNKDWLWEAIKVADNVVVSTQALADWYGRNGAHMQVVRNVVPYETGTVVPGNGAFWAGSLESHAGDLEAVRGQIRSSKFTVAGDLAGVIPATGWDGDLWEAGGWVSSVEEHLARLPGLGGIGIAPLARSHFNECKSWIKPLEMLAAGMPVVVSDVFEYALLSDAMGGSGIRLARRGKDWSRWTSDANAKVLSKELAIALGKSNLESRGLVMNAERAREWAAAWLGVKV